MTGDEERHLLRCGVYASDVEKLRAVATTPAMKAVADFHRSQRGALVLFGGWGSGKTLAASQWLLNAKRWSEGPEWRWDVEGSALVKAAALFALNPKFGPDRVEFERYCSMRWLVVDDLGLEVDVANVDWFFDQRCSRRVRTVVTTNMQCPTPQNPKSEFLVRYGGRVVSRMTPSGTFAFTGTRDLRSGGAR